MTEHNWKFPGLGMAAAWIVAIKFEPTLLQLAV
jgi:hypothetical protein